MDRNWIYAIKTPMNTWDVLHTDYIKDQTSLHLLCKTMTNNRELFCNHGRIEERTNMKPTPTCTERIRANVSLLINEISCLRMKGELYNVYYTLLSNTISLYKVCYSKVTEQALYSRHKSYGFNLAASTYMRPSFSRNNIVSRERELSFQAANIYNAFVKLLGPKQPYISNNRTLILERGHLVNSQDFPTYDQMDETFKYVNVMPQFRGSNRSNWKRIENWIHSLPASNTYADVVTGSFDILRLPHSQTNTMIPMYLMDNEKNLIPLWSYKVVKYGGMCYAFVTLNNDFNTNPNTSTPYCRSIACPRGLQFNMAPDSGISYCCNYNHFVRNIGRHAVLC